MGKLHELLAVERTKVTAVGKILSETDIKFGKDNFFKGYTKTLRMLADSPENSALEQSLSEVRELPTTVVDTLDYALNLWAEAEDIVYQKNVTNRRAIADLEFDEQILVKDVPVDELMGLEVRLENLRKIFEKIPTHDATKKWIEDSQRGKGIWITQNPDVTTKTEKRTVPVILHEATKEHPAQVKESTKDEVVGTFTTVHISGAATSLQKATIMSTMDKLISEVKKARMRANSVEASTDKIGSTLVDIIMKVFS